jgi:hypothetical protein
VLALQGEIEDANDVLQTAEATLTEKSEECDVAVAAFETARKSLEEAREVAAALATKIREALGS